MDGRLRTRPQAQRRTAGGGLLFGLFLLAISLWPDLSHAQYLKDAPLLKAAYVFNFAKFASWPKGAWGDHNSPLVICFAGDDDLVASLQRLGRQNVGGRPVEVVPDQAGLSQCHMLYLAASEKNDVAAWLEKARGKPVLTISELAGFSRSGGMIELFEHQDRIRFRINIAAVHAANLRLSSRLLNLADIVDEGADP